jgi:hypothetical protein
MAINIGCHLSIIEGFEQLAARQWTKFSQVWALWQAIRPWAEPTLCQGAFTMAWSSDHEFGSVAFGLPLLGCGTPAMQGAEIGMPHSGAATLRTG